MQFQVLDYLPFGQSAFHLSFTVLLHYRFSVDIKIVELFISKNQAILPNSYTSMVLERGLMC